MITDSDRDSVAAIARMLGMSSEMEVHFHRLIEAVEKCDDDWLAAVTTFQITEPTFTNDHAHMVRAFWQTMG